MKQVVMLCLMIAGVHAVALETKDITIPNEKYTIYDVSPFGSDLILNIIKGSGVGQITSDGIRLQDESDMTQWARDALLSQNNGHPVYTIFSVGQAKESVCITGSYSTVSNVGGGSGNGNTGIGSDDGMFDVDVLNMKMTIYVDQPGDADVEWKLFLGPPWYEVGHVWYQLWIADVANQAIEDPKLELLISKSLFSVMNKPMGWYPKVHTWPYYDVPGKFKIPDDEHAADVVKIFPLGRVGFGKALIFSKTMKTSTANWVVKSWNCSDVTHGAAIEAGLALPNVMGTLPVVLGGGSFSCPGLFGAFLRDNYPNN